MILCQLSSTMNLDSTKPLLTTPSRKAHFRNFDRTRRDILRIYTHNTTILLSTLPILFPALPRRTCRRPLFPEYVNVLLETCRISDYIKDSFAKSSASKFRSRMTRFTAYLRSLDTYFFDTPDTFFRHSRYFFRHSRDIHEGVCYSRNTLNVLFEIVAMFILRSPVILAAYLYSR